MNKIRLMADYGCDPLWKQPPFGVGNFPLESLPLSEPLIKALRDWASEYDRTYNDSYPPSSGFETQEAADRFNATGSKLLARLKAELGTAYSLEYLPNAYPKVAD